MASYIELERSIDSITVGVRHRTDLGDMGPLMASIQRLGLLQPITITPDGVLVCGRRRLEVIRRMGWRTLKVWVRSGLSDTLSSLLAQQDENALHKPFTPLEASSLYREMKNVMAEDAARRQKATQFGAPPDAKAPEGAGDAESASPQTPAGTTRRQAAELVTGKAGYSRLEQISELEHTAADEQEPESIRQLTVAELEGIGQGGPVDPAYRRVHAAKRSIRHHGAEDQDTAELERLAADALARIRDGRKTERRVQTRPSKRGIRAFLLTWSDLDGWTDSYDPTEIGTTLDDSDWEMFNRVLTESLAFADTARRARNQRRTVASV